uniref:DDE-1 domain-containing protein n=1 Tax=Daphnia galeata TaxID=27404 RepID=A0A8J2RS77_9CRUS|nr:unnamed protein product [Daphnia galeata]
MQTFTLNGASQKGKPPKVGSNPSKVKCFESVDWDMKSSYNRRVFTPQQESELAAYLITAQKLNHGLTPADTRKLAFLYGKANQIAIPNSWQLREEAGPDWFATLVKRNPILSIRKPERTSQARAAVVNHLVIDKFYDDLFYLYDKYMFPPEKIYNCDETNNPTVVDPQNIVAEKGAKAVSSSTGAEQGINVTMLAFVNAAGEAFPRVFIYPRKKVNLAKMVDLPQGILPLSHPSGWMNDDLFLISLKHFKEQITCSPEDPILLTLDNHTSHISYPVVDYCKANGIILFTLPPHTSHVLQPLDKGLFGPMKEDLKKEHREWMRLHPGQRIGINDVPRLTRGPYNRGFNQQNIKSSFSSSVTDLPAVEHPCFPQHQSSCQQLATPSSSNGVPATHLTPEEVVPHPRVVQTGPRMSKNRNRGASRVLTNSPEMAKLKDSYNLKVLKETNRLSKESIARPKKNQKKDSGGKAEAKLGYSETKSQLAAKKTRNTVKKTNVTRSNTNEKNIPPVDDDYIPHNRLPTNSTNKKAMKLRSVNRQVF